MHNGYGTIWYLWDTEPGVNADISSGDMNLLFQNNEACLDTHKNLCTRTRCCVFCITDVKDFLIMQPL